MTKGYLLDTSVVSALAPGREAFVSTTLSAWLQANHQVLFLPSVAIPEMAKNANLYLLTCNIKHFEPLGVKCTDTLVALPE